MYSRYLMIIVQIFYIGERRWQNPEESVYLQGTTPSKFVCQHIRADCQSNSTTLIRFIPLYVIVYFSQNGHMLYTPLYGQIYGKTFSLFLSDAFEFSSS